MKLPKRLFAAFLFSLTLVFVIPCSGNILGQHYVAKAASEINYKNVIVQKGQKFTLKVTGTRKKVKWKSSKPKVASVSKSGKVSCKKSGTAKVTAVVGKKKYNCTIKVMTADQITKKLSDAYEWQVNDLWNNGFCNIYHYIEDGTDALGRQMDINYTISKLYSSIKNGKKYDDFVSRLQGSKYTKYKKCWNTLISERIYLLECLNLGTPTPKSNFFFPYQGFRDAIWDLYSFI